MLAELAQELMELTVVQKGVEQPLYAIASIELCCCLSCTCTSS